MRIAIVGFAGGHLPADAPVLTGAHFRVMVQRAEQIIGELVGSSWDAVEFVSGGAAWADHVAIRMHLDRPETKLTVWAPCFMRQDGRFLEKNNVGRLANRLHHQFSQATGMDSFADLSRVRNSVDMRCSGFHQRNERIADGCDYMIAFSWASGAEPTEGGTRHTWSLCRAPKIHVPMGSLAIGTPKRALDSYSTDRPPMQPAEEKVVYVQSFDIESTGHRTPGGHDRVFAVGSATLEVNCATGVVKEVEARRWVVRLAPVAPADVWAARWSDFGEMLCWEEFWCKHVDTLNKMMGMDEFMFDTEAEMMASINQHLVDTEAKYPRLIRVYDTIGFDVSSLDYMLIRCGFTPIFLCRTLRKADVSYLGDVTRAALGWSPLDRKLSEAQIQERADHNKRALPEGLSHTHDPADDALCIAHKWVHYALMMHRN